MTLDTVLREVAVSLINENGKSMTYRRNARTEYDPSTGQHAVDAVSEEEVKGVIEAYEARLINETSIKTGDRRVLIAAADLEFTPEPGHHLIIDDEVWNVVRHEAFYSGEQVALFALQVRI